MKARLSYRKYQGHLRYLCIMSVVVLTTILLIMAAFPVQAHAVNEPGLDVILLIDNSGSMLFSDTDRAALSAANAFIDIMDTQASRIGVIGFTDSLNAVIPLTALNDPVEKEAVKHTISGFTYYGYTDIGMALIEAARMHTADISGNNQPIIILMTDGMIEINPAKHQRTVDDSYADVEKALVMLNGNIPVYTIGLNQGDRVDVDFLQTLAEGTNARSYITMEADDLTGIYSQIYAECLVAMMPEEQEAHSEEADNLTGDLPDEVLLDEPDQPSDQQTDQPIDPSNSEAPSDTSTADNPAPNDVPTDIPTPEPVNNPSNDEMTAPADFNEAEDTPSLSQTAYLIITAVFVTVAAATAGCIIMIVKKRKQTRHLSGHLDVRAMTGDGRYTDWQTASLNECEGRTALVDIFNNYLTNNGEILLVSVDIDGIYLLPFQKKGKPLIMIDNRQDCEISDEGNNIWVKKRNIWPTNQTITLTNRVAVDMSKLEMVFR